jgi:hypothetical protein
VELIWLTQRLAPDFKTIADFRKDNGQAIPRVCREFVVWCRKLELFSEALVAIDGSKFKAANRRTTHCITPVARVRHIGDAGWPQIILGFPARIRDSPRRVRHRRTLCRTLTTGGSRRFAV